MPKTSKKAAAKTKGVKRKKAAPRAKTLKVTRAATSKRGRTVRANGTEKLLKSVPFRVTDPERIPVQRYYDAEFFKLEKERLWPHVWQMACRLEEIPEVGDWVEYQILEKSVIVVRTKGGIKAFHNACRHRGVRFANGHGNCENTGFVCPFHGWRWNMDGENTFVFGRKIFSEHNLKQAELALKPCRVETWGGCAFINFDNKAPALLECLGPVAKRLDAHNVDKLKVEWWKSAIVPVNWKTAMEAFMEGYHVMRTHPQLHVHSPGSRYGSSGGGVETASPRTSREFVDTMLRHLRVLSDGMGGLVHSSEVDIAESLRDMPLPDDPSQAIGAFYTKVKDEITTRFRARNIPVPDLNKAWTDNPISYVEYIFPHYFLLPMFSAFSSYRVRPLTPETCLFEIWSLILMPEDEQRDPPVAPTPTAHDDPSYPAIPKQDYSNLPLQQLGLHADGFDYMRLSKDEEGMISNYQRLIDGYLAGLPSSKLTKAIPIVCDGFNGPISDIGF
jgi:phenylpropionate dioxygenase-like ring-hydroxylating dioxygenase large terminal subunit